MKAHLYNGLNCIGETRNFRFSVYHAMILHPEITSAWMDNGGWVIYRSDVPKRYLNPKNYTRLDTENLVMYDTK